MFFCTCLDFWEQYCFSLHTAKPKFLPFFSTVHSSVCFAFMVSASPCFSFSGGIMPWQITKKQVYSPLQADIYFLCMLCAFIPLRLHSTIFAGRSYGCLALPYPSCIVVGLRQPCHKLVSCCRPRGENNERNLKIIYKDPCQTFRPDPKLSPLIHHCLSMVREEPKSS